MIRIPIIFLSLCAAATAWSPQPKPSITTFRSPQPQSQFHQENSFDPTNLSNVKSSRHDDISAGTLRPEAAVLASAAVPALIFRPEAASAAAAFTSNAVPSALAAYGHYLSLLGCIVYERLSIKPNMTPEEEEKLGFADIGLGVWGALIAYTGNLRTCETEKGFDFYSHEPLFWLKIAFVGVFGVSSFFNTVTIIKRTVEYKKDGKFEPMGDKLSKRMIQICNAELVAIAIIPLVATFMARGVGYSQDIPWQVEAGLAALVFGGLSFKYVKEALTFEDVPFVEAATSVDSSSSE